LSGLTIAIDAACSLVAVMLASFSLYTLIAMRAKGVRRSLWVPILVSSIFFLLGSISSILEDYLNITEEMEMLHHLSWLIGLSILTYGVYIYFLMVKKAT